MSRPTSDPGRLLGETFAVVHGNLPLAGGAFVVTTAIGVAGHLAAWPPSAVNLLLLPVQLFFQYELTLAALAQNGLAVRQSRRRLWALLGLGIVSGIGILLGLVLLILPGLYLYVRWSVATPVLIAEEAGPIQALTRSGEEVSGRFWPVAGLFLLVGLPWLAGILVTGLMEPLKLVATLLSNALLDLSVVLAWCAAVAVYSDGRTDERLSEVFA